MYTKITAPASQTGDPGAARVFNFFNKYNLTFLIIGLILFVAGIFIDIYLGKVNELWVVIVSHFCLILGEALIVFYFVNVVLEGQVKAHFLHETKVLITEIESDFKEELLVENKRVIEDHLKAIIASFEATSATLLLKTSTLFDVINNDIFRMILQERTSKEVADELCDNSFFKSGFLKIQREMVYRFLPLPGQDNIMVLKQFDDFDIKNISDTTADYFLTLALTSTISKKYAFKSAKARDGAQGGYRDITMADFEIIKVDNLNGGVEYRLKKGLTLKANECMNIHRSFDTTFIMNDSGLDDFFFTTRYMTPFPLKVHVPDGYDFILYPTFDQEKLAPPVLDEDMKVYQIPFLIPGHGYTFSLVRKQGGGGGLKSGKKL